MPAIINPSFEVGGALPGLADSWELLSSATVEQYADFDSAIPEALEDFEEEWGSNEDYLFGWDDVSFDWAGFDTSLGLEAIEDFEEGWDSNEHYEFGLGATTYASFDAATPEDTEDFEEEWGSNEDYFFSWDEVVAELASFDMTVPESIEDFEEEWVDVYCFGFDDWVGGPAFILFDHGTTFWEDFSDVDSIPVPDSGIGAEVDVGPAFRVVVTIVGTFVGYFYVQIKNQGEFEDYGDPINVSGEEVVLPEGTTGVRFREVGYTGGTKTGSYRLADLEAMP